MALPNIMRCTTQHLFRRAIQEQSKAFQRHSHFKHTACVSFSPVGLKSRGSNHVFLCHSQLPSAVFLRNIHASKHLCKEGASSESKVTENKDQDDKKNATTGTAFNKESMATGKTVQLNRSSSVDADRFQFFGLNNYITHFPFVLYGIGGLIPFTAVPIYMHITDCFYPELAHAQLAYGACILSFLGGVAWGNDLKKGAESGVNLQSLGYGILLPLVAWGAIVMNQNVLSFVVLISSFSFAGYVDTRFKDYPGWFKGLRAFLSFFVVASLFSTAVFEYSKQPHQVKDENKEQTEE